MQTKDKAMIAIVCVALGILLVIQFRIVQGNQGALSPNQKSVELAGELKKAQDEKESLQREVARYEEKLSTVQTSASKDNAFLKSINDDLDRYRMIGGFKDVKGQGVTVSVDNPPKDANFNANVDILDDYSLLLEVVNEMKAAGAEAIAFNDQRLIATSEIRRAGDAINVNTVPLKPPYVIKAIGNKDTLEGAMNLEYGIVSILREHRYLVSVRKSDDIAIPRFKDVVKLKYAAPVDAQQ